MTEERYCDYTADTSSRPTTSTMWPYTTLACTNPCESTFHVCPPSAFSLSRPQLPRAAMNHGIMGGEHMLEETDSLPSALSRSKSSIHYRKMCWISICSPFNHFSFCAPAQWAKSSLKYTKWLLSITEVPIDSDQSIPLILSRGVITREIKQLAQS